MITCTDKLQSLGSATFSSIISEDYTIAARVDAGTKAQELQKLIVERIRLFLHSQTEQIRHDAKWIEKNVKVDMVQRIRLRRTLKTANGQQFAKVQEVTAAITEQAGLKVLYVTPKFQLFDVSQLLITLVLYKPKLHSSLLLESLLSTDLVTLKTRGYNVDRILRARAAEARLAEKARKEREAERAKSLQEEAKREEERARQAELEAKKQKESVGTTMPGGFGSPGGLKGNDQPPPQVTGPPVSSLFNRVSRHFGFSDKDKNKGIFGGALGGSNDSVGGSNVSLIPQETSIVRSPENNPPVHKPTKPHVLRSNLQSAINASRPHNSSQVFNPAQTQQVQEQKTYCDSRPGHDIKFLTEMPSGIRVFIERHVDPAFLRANIAELNSFSTILLEVAAIFDLSTGVIHIYYDEMGPTIAFNLNGSLFFNFRYYKELHYSGISSGSEEASLKAKREALVYWFVTACHELGHNIVKDHSSDHSFYTESFVQMFFAECMNRCLNIQHAQGDSTAVVRGSLPPSYDAATGGGALKN